MMFPSAPISTQPSRFSPLVEEYKFADSRHPSQEASKTKTKTKTKTKNKNKKNKKKKKTWVNKKQNNNNKASKKLETHSASWRNQQTPRPATPSPSSTRPTPRTPPLSHSAPTTPPSPLSHPSSTSPPPSAPTANLIPDPRTPTGKPRARLSELADRSLLEDRSHTGCQHVLCLLARLVQFRGSLVQQSRNVSVALAACVQVQVRGSSDTHSMHCSYQDDHDLLFATTVQRYRAGQRAREIPRDELRAFQVVKQLLLVCRGARTPSASALVLEGERLLQALDMAAHEARVPRKKLAKEPCRALGVERGTMLHSARAVTPPSALEFQRGYASQDVRSSDRSAYTQMMSGRVSEYKLFSSRGGVMAYGAGESL